MPPKGLAGRPPESSIHQLYDRDQESQATNPVYRCKSCNGEVKGKDLTKMFIHTSSCPNMTEEDKERARIAFSEYQAKKQAKRLAAVEKETSSGSGASSGSKKRKESGPLDRHVDTKVFFATLFLSWHLHDQPFPSQGYYQSMVATLNGTELPIALQAINKGQLATINRALMIFIVCCGVSFNVIDSPHFAHFLQLLRPNYSLPGAWPIPNW